MERAFAVGLENPVLPALLGQGAKEQGTKGLGVLIGNLVGLLFIGGFILSLFFLITGAISWITSGGDKNNLENARNRIVHAIMGLIILAAVWAIFTLVGQFVGLDIKKLPIPTIQ